MTVPEAARDLSPPSCALTEEGGATCTPSGSKTLVSWTKETCGAKSGCFQVLETSVLGTQEAQEQPGSRGANLGRKEEHECSHCPDGEMKEHDRKAFAY